MRSHALLPAFRLDDVEVMHWRAVLQSLGDEDCDLSLAARDPLGEPT